MMRVIHSKVVLYSEQTLIKLYLFVDLNWDKKIVSEPSKRWSNQRKGEEKRLIIIKVVICFKCNKV